MHQHLPGPFFVEFIANKASLSLCFWTTKLYNKTQCTINTRCVQHMAASYILTRQVRAILTPSRLELLSFSSRRAMFPTIWTQDLLGENQGGSIVFPCLPVKTKVGEQKTVAKENKYICTGKLVIILLSVLPIIWLLKFKANWYSMGRILAISSLSFNELWISWFKKPCKVDFTNIEEKKRISWVGTFHRHCLLLCNMRRRISKEWI